jgi:mono/diheme cytochrome c family protein
MRWATWCVFLGLAGAARAGTIEVWVRPPAGAPDRGVVARVDPARLTVREEARFDLQYGAKLRFRGLPLKVLLAELEPPRGTDAAVLHFRNGMAVPVPLAAPPDVWLAVALADEKGAWSADFPPVYKGGADRDRRPIRFEGNKLVAATPDHPDVPARLRDSGFTPWRHADSLAGVEFVDRAAYDAQFDVSPAAHEGYAVFLGTCRFCHGARHVGASLGWDFVEPLPAAEYRATAANLLDHVTIRASDAPERGLMMPAIAAFTPEDAAAVHAWMKALAAQPLRPYAPARPQAAGR